MRSHRSAATSVFVFHPNGTTSGNARRAAPSQSGAPCSSKPPSRQENQLRRIEIKLSLEPRLARLGDIVSFLFRGMAGLLLARDPVSVQEPPHRSIAEADVVAFLDFLSQLHDRHIGLRLDLPEDEMGVRLDAPRSAVAAHLHWRDVSRGLDALGPANRGGRTDIKTRRSLTARHSARDRLHHLLANIHRKRHNPLPQPRPAFSSTSAASDMGILPTILNPLLNRHARIAL